jgi:hypothetical protein
MAFSAISLNLLYIFSYGQNNFAIEGCLLIQWAQNDKISVQILLGHRQEGQQLIAARQV